MSVVRIKRFLLGGWIGVQVLRLRKCLHSLADTNYFCWVCLVFLNSFPAVLIYIYIFPI